jgi:hypothetical protein
MRRQAMPLLGILLLVIIAGLWSASLRVSAQEVQPLATNTPRILPTNTPRPPEATPMMPDAALDFYALRLWDERGLVELLTAQVRALREGDADSALAVRLLQHALDVRFPGAPRDPTQRAALLDVMLAAPLGSVDMREMARRHLIDVLSAQQVSLDEPIDLIVGDWLHVITPANVDNRPPADAMVVSSYGMDFAMPKPYTDAVFVTGAPGQGYRLFEADYPAAPLGDVVRLPTAVLADANADGLDDLVVSIHTGVANNGGSFNDEMRIYGWRGDAVVNLIAPGESVRYRSIRFQGDQWLTNGRFTVDVARTESARWGCVAQQPVEWAWVLNNFRPESRGTFVEQPSLGCTVFDLGDLFATPLDDAIEQVEDAFGRAATTDPTAGRVQLGLAVLLAMRGDEERALQLVGDYGDPDLQAQAAALRRGIADGDTQAQLCAAVVAAAASPESALCDMDGVLARLFSEAPLRRDDDLEAQLEALGIRVRERTTIQQVGRLDRQAFRFNLAGSGWWAFAPLEAETYTAEPIPTPPGFEPSARTPRILDVPDAALDALLRGDTTAALVALENARQSLPGVPATAAFDFLRVLTLDLAANRTEARTGYYALWTRDPGSVWGQVAAAHLERR